MKLSAVTPKSIAKSLLYIFIGIIALLLFLSSLLYTLVFTQAGREWTLTSGLDWLNSSSTFKNQQLIVELSDPTFTSLDILTFKKLSIKKHEKIWIEIDNFVFHWSLDEIFNKHLNIKTLTSDRIFYDHQLSQTTTSNTDSTAKEISFNIEQYITMVSLDDLTIQALDIRNLLPETTRAELDIENRIHYKFSTNVEFDSHKTLAVVLNAQPLLEQFPSLSVKTDSVSINEHRIIGNLTEPAGGITSKLLKVPGSQKIDVTVDIGVKKHDKIYTFDIAQLKLPIAQEQLSLVANLDFVPQVPVSNNSASTPEHTWQLNIKSSTLNLSGTEHHFSGAITYPIINLDVDVNEFPIRLVSPWVPQIQGGSINTESNISGTFKEPKFKGTLAANSNYNQIPVAVSLQGIGSLKAVSLDDAQVTSNNSKLAVNGNINIEDKDLDINFIGDNIDTHLVAKFYDQLPKDLYYKINHAQGSLLGNYLNPNGNIVLEGQGKYQVNSFTTHISGSKQQNKVSIRSLDVILPEGKSHVEGFIDIDTLEGNLTGSINELPLYLASAAGIELPESLSAIFNGTFTASGNLKNPTVEANIKTQGQFQDIPFKANLIGSSDTQKYLLNELTVFAYQQQVLNAHGQYQGEEFQVSVEADQLPTQLLQALAIPIKPGNFQAKIDANGSIKRPVVIGNLLYKTTFDGYSRTGDSQKVGLSLGVDFHNNDENIIINSTIKRDNNPPGFINIKAPFYRYIDLALNNSLSNAIPIDASVNAEIGLQTLSFFVDPDIHRIHGRLKANTDISGELTAPKIVGSIELTNGRYQNVLIGTVIDKIECLINSTNYQFEFDVCTANDGGKGQYDITGGIVLPLTNGKNSGEIDITLIANAASIIRRPEVESETTGNISVKGSFKELTAAGKLNVSPLQAVLKNTTNTSVAQIEVEEVYETQENSTQQYLENKSPIVHLNLIITADRQAYLRGRGVEAELSGEIKLSGTVDEPQYNGDFKTVRGQFEVFGKTFQLEQGNVGFVNNAVAIAITGVYNKNDLRIQADMSGQNGDYKLKLSSIPSLPEDEILSFIIFGESVTDITPIKALQLASAVQTLSGGGEGAVFNTLATTRELLGVDTLTVDTETTADGEDGLNVGIGKYINDKVYLELERTPNPSQPWKGTIEIELSPRINLQSSTGGTSGIDSAEIIWKKDY